MFPNKRAENHRSLTVSTFYDSCYRSDDSVSTGWLLKISWPFYTKQLTQRAKAKKKQMGPHIVILSLKIFTSLMTISGIIINVPLINIDNSSAHWNIFLSKMYVILGKNFLFPRCFRYFAMAGKKLQFRTPTLFGRANQT